MTTSIHAPEARAVLRGEPANAIIKAEALRFAQEHSRKTTGRIMGHPAKPYMAKLSAVERDEAVLQWPDGRCARYPLAEIFDPRIALAYIKNLGSIGAALHFDTETGTIGALQPAQGSVPSLLSGPPPLTFVAELPPDARETLILAWHGLRTSLAQWRAGHLGLLCADKSEGLAGFLPKEALRSVLQAHFGVRPEHAVFAEAAPDVSLRLVLVTDLGVHVRDLALPPERLEEGTTA